MKMDEEFQEKQSGSRLNVSMEARGRVLAGGDEVRDCRIIDISAGGCLLLCTEELSAGIDIELDICLDDPEEGTLKLKGKVIRLIMEDEGAYEAGVAFEHLDKKTLKKFTDYCFKKMYEMTGLPEWPTDRTVID